MPGDPITQEIASLPRREPLILRENLPPDLDDVRMSQLVALTRVFLEDRLPENDWYWLSWSRHLGALPLDLLDAWFESRYGFCFLMGRDRIARMVLPDSPG